MEIDETFWQNGNANWYRAPGQQSTATHHGDFDDDAKTLLTTLRRITGGGTSAAVVEAAAMARTPSPAQIRRIRRNLGSALMRQGVLR